MKERPGSLFSKERYFLLFSFGYFLTGILFAIGAIKRDAPFYMLVAFLNICVGVLHMVRYFCGKNASDEPDDVWLGHWIVRHFWLKWKKAHDVDE